MSSNKGNISANIGEERKKLLQKFADNKFNKNLSKAVIYAVDRLLDEEKSSVDSLPAGIKNSVNYMRQIVENGTPKDWDLIKVEVIALCKTLNGQ